jgi:hypothetical protein
MSMINLSFYIRAATIRAATIRAATKRVCNPWLTSLLILFPPF